MPEPIAILKPGTFHAMNGEEVTFTAADLKSAVASYDPALHEAPIVVGHPKTDAPAYGWVKSLSVVGDELVAEPHQVDDQFAELVRAGRFKKVSPALYRPDAKNNPKPGSWYLRHIGFLGAQPPAVKGLKSVSLSDADAGVIELADGWVIGDVARALRSLRDWILGKFGQEDADKAIDGGMVDWLQQQAGREQQKDMATNSFADLSKETDVTTKTQDVAALDARAKQLEDQQVQLSEGQKKLKEQQAQIRRDDNARFVDGLVNVGKVPPAMKDGLVAFMSSLPEEGVVSFGEGAAKVEKAPGAFFREMLGQLGKVIEFSEIAPSDKTAPTDDPVALAEEIRVEQDKAAAVGRPISVSDALERVKKNRK